MCLYVDKNLTEKAKTRKTGVTVIRYRILEFIGKKLVSPFYGIPWKVGINKSDANHRSKLNIRKRTPKEVNRGIHVYVNRKEAYNAYASTKYDYPFFGSPCVILPVHCKNEDLIAVGHNSDKQQEVYTQVTLKKISRKLA